MILVRHGLMVVGLPFSGKSAAIHTLAKTLTQLCEEGLQGEKITDIIKMNPKSV